MQLRPLEFDIKTKLGLTKPIPKELLKTRKSGGTDLTYIAHNTAIDILNNIFGFAWSFEIVNSWLQESPPHIKKENPKYPFTDKTADMNQIKIDPEGKRYLEIPQLPVAWCQVRITVPMKTENGEIVYISKEAFGSACLTGNQNTQSMSGFKAAQSDAIKKAASLFGVALSLYRDETEEAYFQSLRSDMMTDVWTSDVISCNQDKYNQLLDLLEEYGWSFDDLSWYVNDITDGHYTNFVKMPVEYIDTLLKAIQEE